MNNQADINCLQPLIATKEVNTDVASIGDVISYTITITNVSSQNISCIVVKDIIDESLEVEENSIGVNGVAIVNQSLNNVVVPTLAPMQSHTVVFNAYVRRLPQNESFIIRETADIYYTVEGCRYKTTTSEAITSINGSLPIEDNYISATIQANKCLVNLNDIIEFNVCIEPRQYVNLVNLILSIDLDSNLLFIPESLKINQVPYIGDISNLKLPNLYGAITCEPLSIVVSYATRVINKPSIIRALIPTVANITYEVAYSNIQNTISTNEVLVEVMPCITTINQQVNMLLEGTSGGIRYLTSLDIINAGIAPVSTTPLLTQVNYTVVVAYVNWNGENAQFTQQRSEVIEWPYSSAMKVNVINCDEPVTCSGYDLQFTITIILEA